MSQENVEVVRRLWDEFQEGMDRGNPGAWFDSGAMTDDFEWILTVPFDGKSVWRGREEWVKFIRTWTAEFQDWSIRAERLIDAGQDQIVVLSHQTATGKESAPAELNLGQVFELEDGRVARVTNCLSHAEALEAVGLWE
jgi:hypothetical protein